MKRIFLLLMVCLFSLFSYAQIPNVCLRDVNGKMIKTEELNNDGKPFIIMFFASWCKPCNRELDNISEVYDVWQEETGVKIFAVSIDEGQNSQKVKPFVDNHGWEYEILLDPNSEFRRSLGIQMIPHTLVFDGAQTLVYSHSGYQDGSEKMLFEKIKSL